MPSATARFASRSTRSKRPDAANGASDGRHHLAHLQVVDPLDYPRFAQLDATATIQPYWACNDAQMTELTMPFLPAGRRDLQYPFASLRDAGARLVGGSDWSVSTPNVMAEVEVAVTRRATDQRSGAPFIAAQALDLEDAGGVHERHGVREPSRP